MKRASIAIEAHQNATARSECAKGGSAQRDMADILYGLATAPTSFIGCAAVAAYVATLPPGDLPDGWLATFAGVVARVIEGGAARR